MGRTKQEYDIEYRLTNVDKICEAKKTYREQNRDKTLEYGKTYREQNKETLQTKQNETHVCEICLAAYTHKNKAKHLKTAKHIQLSSASSSSTSDSTE